MNTSDLLPVGKLKSDYLKKLIERFCQVDDRVIVGPKIGEDAAVIDVGDRYLVATTDPITFATDEIGWYTLQINANDIATMGATSKWLLATILLPEKSASEAMVESIFSQLSSACQGLDISLCGGHTEITGGIDRPIVVGLMLGEVERSKLVTTSGARVGDDVLLTKGIAIEATSILARECADVLGDTFSKEFLDRCRQYLFDPGISVVRDAHIATQAAAARAARVHAMHDPTEGGLATGLHEMCAAAGVGMMIRREKILVFPESKELCSHFHLDPLGSIASGALLIALAREDTESVLRAFESNGIHVSVIGRVEEKAFGVKMEEKGTVRDLPTFERDEIARVFEP